MQGKLYGFFAVGILLLCLLVSAKLFAEPVNGADQHRLLHTTWAWSAWIEDVPASLTIVPDAHRYRLVFLPEGRLRIQADCNRVSGHYRLQAGVLRITLGASTRAYCGDQSLDQLFLKQLAHVQAYRINTKGLQLELEPPLGHLSFVAMLLD